MWNGKFLAAAKTCHALVKVCLMCTVIITSVGAMTGFHSSLHIGHHKAVTCLLMIEQGRVASLSVVV